MSDKKTNKTHLNPAYCIDAGVNSRRYGDGDPIEVAMYIDSNDKLVCRYLDQETANGGSMTPFNIVCNAHGACAIKKIIFDGDETNVLFADGDKVVLHRHSDDANDKVTAVLWALGEKVFGQDVARQIKRAIKYRAADRADLHKEKQDMKNKKEKQVTKDSNLD